MKTVRPKSSARTEASLELVVLRARLTEAEETLHAIRSGEVDAVMSASKQGPQVFTLQGAEHAYRVLIESMNEGALTLTADKTILYSNQRFAKMVKYPLEQVMGSSFRRFISTEDRDLLKRLSKQVGNSGFKIQVLLNAKDGSHVPVQLSICPLAKSGVAHATSVVVTDTTEARRTEELLRSLTHHVVQVQEAERGRVALELHDNITQLLCAVMARYQVLTDNLSKHDGPLKREAVKLLGMLGKTIEEVERVSRNLRPSVLEHLGLVAVLESARTEFANRTGLSVKLSCVKLTVRLPADTELALYRILQETLKNVEKHAHARHVTVQLTNQDSIAQLTIKDDGIGFDPKPLANGRKRKKGLGLLGMRERASYVGGTLKIKSVLRAGTEVQARIPLPTTQVKKTSGSIKTKKNLLLQNVNSKAHKSNLMSNRHPA